MKCFLMVISVHGRYILERLDFILSKTKQKKNYYINCNKKIIMKRCVKTSFQLPVED